MPKHVHRVSFGKENKNHRSANFVELLGGKICKQNYIAAGSEAYRDPMFAKLEIHGKIKIFALCSALSWSWGVYEGVLKYLRHPIATVSMMVKFYEPLVPTHD